MPKYTLTPSQYRRSLFFAALALLIGGAMFAFGISFVRQANESNAWPSAEGFVRSTRVLRDYSTTSSSNNASFYVVVTYAYVVDDFTHTSERFSLGRGSTASKNYNTREEAQAYASETYPSGTSVTVYYDPTDPNSAVLSNGASFSTYVPIILGIFFLACGIALFYSTRKTYKAQLEAESL